MKRLLISLIVGALVSLNVPIAAARGAVSNDALSFYLYDNHAARPVDYLTWCGDCVGTDYTTNSPWVVNPGTYWPFTDIIYTNPPVSSEPGCAWDSDDFYEFHSTGNIIGPNTTLTIKACRYTTGSEYPQLLTDSHFSSSSPDLIVTQTWISDGETKSYTVTPTFNKSTRLWEYFACVNSPRAIGPLVTIPDSNGGQAVIQKIEITVTNPTSRKIGKTGGLFMSGIQDAWCDSWINI